MRHAILGCVAVISFFTASCGKIELDDTAEDKKSTAGSPGTEIAAADTAAVAARCITVADALSLPVGTEVAVRGYIVGYIGGTSLSAAIFDASFDKANTNMLIAGRANEVYESDCMPVKLVTTGANPRAALNLYDHPENLGREIVVCGNIATYFKVNGFLSFRYYWTGNRGQTGLFGGDDDTGGQGQTAGRLPVVQSGWAVMNGR